MKECLNKNGKRENFVLFFFNYLLIIYKEFIDGYILRKINAHLLSLNRQEISELSIDENLYPLRVGLVFNIQTFVTQNSNRLYSQ